MAFLVKHKNMRLTRSMTLFGETKRKLIGRKQKRERKWKVEGPSSWLKTEIAMVERNKRWGAVISTRPTDYFRGGAVAEILRDRERN